MKLGKKLKDRIFWISLFCIFVFVAFMFTNRFASGMLYVHRNDPLLIEIDYEDGMRPTNELLWTVENTFENILNRDVILWLDDEVIIDFQVIISETELNMNAFNNRDFTPLLAGNYIYIVCIEEDAIIGEGLMVAGLQTDPYYIAIFVNNSPTWVHEIGHVFGLEHCDNEDCVMYWLQHGQTLFCDECLEKMGVV